MSSDDHHGDRPTDPPEWGDTPPPPPPSSEWDADGPTPLSPWGWDPDATAAAATRPAGVGKRVGAYIIDMILITMVLSIGFALIARGSALMPASPEGFTAANTLAVNLIWSGLTLAYFVLLEAGSGQTLGKRMLSIRVIGPNGAPPPLAAAFKRRVLFVIGNLTPVIGGLISFVVPLAALITAIQDEPANQGFHDRWADTRVVDA